MATVPGLFAASVMVNSSFRLVDRPRPPPRPVMPTCGAGGALSIAAKCASGGRRRRSSVCVSSGHGHGVLSAVLLLPDDTANNTLAAAGEFSYFGAGTAARIISSVPLAAGGRGASRGRVVIVAALGSSLRDGEDEDGDDDDSTKVIFNVRLLKQDEQLKNDCNKYMVAANPEEAVAQSGNRYQYWLKLRVDDVAHQEVTGGEGGRVVVNMTMVFNEKVLVDFFGRVLICGAKLLEDFMRTRPPTSINHELPIGKKLKEAALECQNSFLQSKTLDRWIDGLKP